jgi:uncharacterized membrane protein YgcG
LLNALLLAFLIAAPQLPSVRLFDPGRFLSTGEQEKIQQSLDAYAKESKHEVIVYIDRSTGGQPAASWCRETFNRWRAELPSLDDGVAVFPNIGVASRAQRSIICTFVLIGIALGVESPQGESS